MILMDKYDVAPGFEDLFTQTPEETIAHEAQMLIFRFLSEAERAMVQQHVSRKELAHRVGTSASYITQVFRGDKQPNFELLAKFQQALAISFDVAVRHECPMVSYEVEQPDISLANTRTRSHSHRVQIVYWPKPDYVRLRWSPSAKRMNPVA